MFLVIDNASSTIITHQTSPDSMTEAQATSIAAALPDTWSIDRIVSCDESLALLLTPPGGLDANLAFYVDAHDGGLTLSIMQGDDLRLHSCYGDNINALLAALRLASGL